MQTGHAIITGGSSGIGLALARFLLRRGWVISLIARNPTRLREARSMLETEILDSSRSVFTCPADVTDAGQIESAIQQSVQVNGTPLLLVTSAGAVRPGYFNQLTLEDFEQMTRVNYLGTVYTVKSTVPYMQQQRRGHIIMISSGAGLVGLFGYTAYAPAKFAVRGFAESLRPELKADGIRVSIVYPPDTQTPQLEEERKLRPVETQYISAAGGIMTAEKVAAAILSGYDRGKFCITPGTAMTWLYRLQGLANPLLQKYFDRLVDKSRKKLRNPPPEPD